ncbi:hypothetical protein NIES2134_109770 [Thermostichus vulcanus NIES-2134]|nr:hypothetical protein NIES2134_109770 [Thermostichus vulcanus NIES-2134]
MKKCRRLFTPAPELLILHLVDILPTLKAKDSFRAQA